MMRRLCFPVLTVTCLVAPCLVTAAGLSDVPDNTWTIIHDGKPGIMATYARFMWLPKHKRGFLWPNYDYNSRHFTREMYLNAYLYDPATGKWSARKTKFEPHGRHGRGGLFNSILYLPGLRRVFAMSSCASYAHRRHKPIGTGALLDPDTWEWQAVAGGTVMRHSSRDYNPSPMSDGSAIPQWSTLVYDGHNREAVSVGGAGTWGRVTARPVKVSVGDWIVDETGGPKRIRRLTRRDRGKVTEARKWYPAQCGTWAFSGATLKWSMIRQPLAEQPPGRIVPCVAYDRDEKKIVCFGGDNYMRVLNDTWIYDCASRTWSEAKPTVSPPARALAAMVHVRHEGVILLAGGYTHHWAALKDVWVYHTAENQWTKLGLDLPFVMKFVSGDYDPVTKTVILCHARPGWPKSKKTTLVALSLDLSSAPKADPPPPVPADRAWHCAGGSWKTPLPRDWFSAKNKAGSPEAGRKELLSLPANTWILRKPPMRSRARQWGSYTYDARTHKGIAWGGGHYGYPGNDVGEYDLLTNRWRSSIDPVSFKHAWRLGAAGGPGGVSFQGWRLMGIHARKSYAIDVLSDAMINVHGEVYSLRDHTYVASIGRCPGRYRVGDQVAFVGTPHGLYAFHGKDGGELHKANVAARKWDFIRRGGPKGHHEYCTLSHDAKRDRIIWVNPRNSQVWAFDFKAKKWDPIKPANMPIRGIAGDNTYIHDLDAVMMVCQAKGWKEPQMVFFKLSDRKWYSAPYRGDREGSYGNLNNSPRYDPGLKIVVRQTHIDRNGPVHVLVMRLDAKTLKLTPNDSLPKPGE
jgi:hypothetical protein